jgi:hypothetical protein
MYSGKALAAEQNSSKREEIWGAILAGFERQDPRNPVTMSHLTWTLDK